MDILLTFTGFNDPYSRGKVEGQWHPGPILSLLAARRIDKAFLFNTPKTAEITEKTKREILQRHPEMTVEVLDIPLDDPTVYSQILRGLRSYFSKIIQKHKTANFFIAVASGTPQMHVCWFMLAASGEIPAKILHVRPPLFVTKERPLLEEIDVASGKYPKIKFAPEQTLQEEDLADPKLLMRRMGILGEHPSIHEAFEIAALHADSDDPVLIQGETGTGKELCARYIHVLSRRKGEFVAVNCGAIPDNLVESELFGHVKGAFTGAVENKKGRFETAKGGTMFLDELGDLPLQTQVKLLRVLQDKTIMPVGASMEKKVDVRIVAATNKNLGRMMEEKKFRKDLYYRISVCEVLLPPLRERREDIAILAPAILDEINRMSLKDFKKLTPAAIDRLQSCDWDGNIRELENVITRSARRCRTSSIDAGDLVMSGPSAGHDPLDILPEPFNGFNLKENMETIRHRMIMKALDKTGGNQRKAGKLLGMTSANISKHLKTMERKKGKKVEKK